MVAVHDPARVLPLYRVTFDSMQLHPPCAHSHPTATETDTDADADADADDDDGGDSGEVVTGNDGDGVVVDEAT